MNMAQSEIICYRLNFVLFEFDIFNVYKRQIDTLFYVALNLNFRPIPLNFPQIFILTNHLLATKNTTQKKSLECLKRWQSLRIHFYLYERTYETVKKFTKFECQLAIIAMS